MARRSSPAPAGTASKSGVPPAKRKFASARPHPPPLSNETSIVTTRFSGAPESPSVLCGWDEDEEQALSEFRNSSSPYPSTEGSRQGPFAIILTDSGRMNEFQPAARGAAGVMSFGHSRKWTT